MNRSSVRANLGAIGLTAMCLGFGVYWAQGPNDRRGSLAHGSALGATWAAEVESGGDHFTPTELLRSLEANPDGVLLIDVRPASEYQAFHLSGAHSLDLPSLLGEAGRALLAANGAKTVVLYSNGMVHPAQAWVELARRGHTNVRVLEGGLTHLRDELLTPPSLRPGRDQARARREYSAFRSAKKHLLLPPEKQAHPSPGTAQG